jgi:hypothetical protein
VSSQKNTRRLNGESVASKRDKKKEEPPTWAEVEGSWALSAGRGRNLALIVSGMPLTIVLRRPKSDNMQSHFSRISCRLRVASIRPASTKVATTDRNCTEYFLLTTTNEGRTRLRQTATKIIDKKYEKQLVDPRNNNSPRGQIGIRKLHLATLARAWCFRRQATAATNQVSLDKPGEGNPKRELTFRVTIPTS